MTQPAIYNSSKTRKNTIQTCLTITEAIEITSKMYFSLGYYVSFSIFLKANRGMIYSEFQGEFHHM